jgi:predicted DNA-binding transcriptional regulator YafY
MSRGEVKVKNLAKLYNTTERTIQNDIKELSQVYDIKSVGRGVYKLEMDFSIEQKFEEIFSKFIMKANYDIFPQFGELIKKMEFKTAFHPTDLFEVNFQVEELEDSGILIDFMQSIEWKYAIDFDYKGEKKIIHPLKILNYNAVWYLIGFDLEANKIKTFKINRIKNLISRVENLLGNEINSLKNQAKLFNTPWICDNKQEAVIRVYYPISENVIEEVINETDEYVEIKIIYYDEKELFNKIKKYMPYIKIVDETLKTKIKQFLNEIMEFL